MTFHRLSRKKRILQLKPKLTQSKYKTYYHILIYINHFKLKFFKESLITLSKFKIHLLTENISNDV